MFRCGYIAFSGSANNALQDSWTEEYILDVARKTWLDIICKLEGKLRNQRNRAAGTLLNGRNTRAFRKMTVLLEAAQLRLIRESTMSKQPLWFGWNGNSRGTEAVSFSLRTPSEWYFTKKRSLIQWLYGGQDKLFWINHGLHAGQHYTKQEQRKKSLRRKWTAARSSMFSRLSIGCPYTRTMSCSRMSPRKRSSSTYALSMPWESSNKGTPS